MNYLAPVTRDEADAFDCWNIVQMKPIWADLVEWDCPTCQEPHAMTGKEIAMYRFNYLVEQLCECGAVFKLDQRKWPLRIKHVQSGYRCALGDQR